MSDEAVPPCHHSSYDELAEQMKRAKFHSALRQLGYYVPFSVRLELSEKLFLNSTFGAFGGRSTLYNQEKPMTQCQTPKPAYVPGDRVLCLNKFIGEPGTIEVVFIGFDPEQPTVALVRDVGNVNAPIRGVHNSYIKAVPKIDKHVVEVFARVSRSAGERCIVEHITDFSDGVDSPRRIIDARVTEDGILQVLVDMNAPLKVDAIKAAIANPCVSFTEK